MSITISLYNAVGNYANAPALIDGPDTAYLLTSSYTFGANDALSVPLGDRSIDSIAGTAIPPVGFDVYRNDNAWPTTYLPATISFIAVSSVNVAAILLAASATNIPILFVNLGTTLSPTNTTLSLDMTGIALQVAVT